MPPGRGDRVQVDVVAEDRLSAKERAETLLKDELRKNKETVQIQESAIEELKESFSVKLNALENQVSEKEGLLKDRDEQIKTFNSEGKAFRG